MAAHLKKRVYEEFSKVVQVPHEEAPAKKLRLSKPSKSAALHIDLCKATSSTDALQYLLQFARKPVEAESVEGVIRILLEHYYKETDNSVRLKIASLLGLLSKTQGFSPDCIVDDFINTLANEKSHQVLAQLLDTLLVIGTQLPDSPAVRHRLIEVACKVPAPTALKQIQGADVAPGVSTWPLSLCLSPLAAAPVRHVLWGEEQVSAAAGLSGRGRLSAGQGR
ncbi:unnamed protein product [Tetraodon nigroviridis]|uniref:Integrator complex subunit 4 n=1 Tax=Tetraodon nigroviridis TaxID=99883 RepID=Q4SWL5_TETNG|nr:unnamed protein product [Tetraodon nigroviridis]